MAPLFLLFGPKLAQGAGRVDLDYASSPRWKFPFAPHDLGTYPQANGPGLRRRREDRREPDAGRGDRQHAHPRRRDRADGGQRRLRRAVLAACSRSGREYLKEKGFDPENQLCTDDFAGHLAHNVNLSAKAIVALGAFARLCEMRGEKALAAEYRKLAEAVRRAMDEGGGRRRPLPPGLRPPRHLEPEIQPRLGPAPRSEPLPADRGAAGDGVLSTNPGAIRAAPGQPAALHEARLGDVDRHADRLARRFRGARQPGVRHAERHASPRAHDRLVLDSRRDEGRLPGPVGRRRRVPQAALRRPRLEEVGEPGSSCAPSFVLG